MARELVGRHRERARLRELLSSREAAFLAVYGRRRVGKTFLVREGCGEALCFELAGTKDATLPEQLENFAFALSRQSGGRFPRDGAPSSWLEAMRELIAWYECEAETPGRKRAIFFDELPWLAGRRAKFLPALDYFWNSWGSKRRDLLLVVCGSAASWMIGRLLHHKGGLHNRVTDRMRLEPFSLAETREFLESRGITLTDHHILELYLAFGGVPLYLEKVRRGQSAAQAIDAACFAADGDLRDEFSNLYPALFDSAERHIEIVRALASARKGMTRGDIVAKTAQTQSGRLTTILHELEESGFIRSIAPFGKRKRQTLYRLTDEFSAFHLAWMEGARSGGEGTWLKQQRRPRWRAWSGYAFESVCLRHVRELKAALGIAGVATTEESWRHDPTGDEPDGGQIDLMIDRADNCINLCEMKFCDGEFVIDKRYAKVLRERRELFRRVSGTRKSLFLTFVTTHGVKQNAHALELVDSSVEIGALFASA